MKALRPDKRFFRFYRTHADCQRAITQLRRRGVRYFTEYVERGVPGHTYGLSFGDPVA